MSRNVVTKGVSRRLASTSATKYTAKAKPETQVSPPPTHEEAVKIIERRIHKSERDERMDITTMLTEVKTYMGGFTRPRDLRVTNRMPGGPFVIRGRHYEDPPASAYTPHTVFLAETRLYVRRGVDRPEDRGYIVGVCRADEFEQVMQKFNSPRATSEAFESMDNARWTWIGLKKARNNKWWEDGEDPKKWLEHLKEEIDQELALETQKTSLTRAELVATDSLASSPVTVQRRMFHQSACRAAEPPSGPGSFASRKEHIPKSSWESPRRHPDPRTLPEDVVPTYYVERKRQRDSVAERKEEEGGLMAELSAGILSEGVAARTEARPEKIPVEVLDPVEGVVVHPSGFAPPTPETDFHPAAAKVPTEDHPLVTTVKERWDERPTNPDAPAYPPADASVEQSFVRRKFEQDVDTAAVLVSRTRRNEAEKVATGPAGTFDDVSGASTPASRSKIPTSSWDSPRRGRVDPRTLPDDVVPTYYIERKLMRDDIAERKEEEGGLMAELNAGILGDGLAAELKHREEKIPVEVRDPRDGTVRHPSGFEPPTPETQFHPTAAKVSTEDHPLVETVKVPWVEVKATNGNGNGSSNGNGNSQARSLHTSAILRAMPVSNGAFHLMSSAIAQAPPPVRAISSEAKSKIEDDDVEDEVDVNAPGPAPTPDKAAIRARYLPLVAHEPFWRPLLTVTVSTRPLALSIVRLARCLPRGLPYYASMDSDDRKEPASFKSRMRVLRMERLSTLSLDLAELLGGARGGLAGVRFCATDKGRLVDGEGVADPVPLAQRRVTVGVANWYEREAEVREVLLERAREAIAIAPEAFEVVSIDERGRRTDGQQWPRCEPHSGVQTVEEHARRQNPRVVFEGELHEIRKQRAAYCAEHTEELARALALGRRHPSVIRA